MKSYIIHTFAIIYEQKCVSSALQQLICVKAAELLHCSNKVKIRQMVEVCT